MLVVAARPALVGDAWLPVSPEDLALKDNPKSPGADAMILYRESVISVFESSDDEYIRIKVFTQEGTKEGDVQIPFVKGVSDITAIRARTIRPDGSIVDFEGEPFEKTVVKASGIKVLAKTFTLSDVKPGCIIEYKFRDHDLRLHSNLTWPVQGELFTRLAHLSIESPLFDLTLVPVTFRLPHDVALKKESDRYYALEVHDLPGIEEEEYMPPERTVRARVDFFYRAQDKPETDDQYWKRIGKASSEDLDDFLNKKGALGNDLSRTVGPSDSPETKLWKIYVRVQQIRNLSMEDEKTRKEEKIEKLKDNKNVEDVIKHGYGSARQINCLFVGLTRAAGFEATEVYVTPRNWDFFYSNVQNVSQLDDIAWVRVGTQEYFLDPGSRYFPFGLLPWYESGAGGLRVNKQGGDLIKTPTAPSSDATMVTHADLQLDEEGNVTGKLQVDFTGQRAAIRREENRDEDETGRKKAIEDEINGRLPSGSTFEITKIENWDNNAVPIHVEGTIKVPGFGTAAGRRLLVPATVLGTTQAKAFHSTTRYNDICFHYSSEEIDNIKLTAPEGYKVESVPPAVAPSNALFSYEISVAQQGNTVEVKRHLALRGILFDKKYYSAFKTFFSVMKLNDDAQIVFQSGGSAKQN